VHCAVAGEGKGYVQNLYIAWMTMLAKRRRLTGLNSIWSEDLITD